MVVGTRLSARSPESGEGPVSEQHFRAQWSTPRTASEMKQLGFERPEQLGALFLGDATYIRSLVADAPPLTDDDPKLIEAQSASPEEWARLLASITDTGAARARFERSTFIARHWPDSLLRASGSYFDVQHVIDTHMYGAQVKQSLALDDVHRLLTTTTVSTPPA